MGNSKKIIAEVIAICLTATSAIAPVSASAGQLLGETTFDTKGLPWHTVENSPAKMEFDISDGVYKIHIVNPGGASQGGEERWDCQFRHEGLVMRSIDTYSLSFEMTADQSGKFYTAIGNSADDVEVWHNGNTDASDFNQYWDCIPVNANEKYTMNCTFSPTNDLDSAEWTFHLGGDGQWTPDGCFQSGTTIIFDNMSLINISGGEIEPVIDELSGIEVNQVGYYTNLNKKATIVVNSIDDKPQEFKVVDSNGNVVYTGKTSATMDDTSDSGNFVQIADFSDFTEEGTDYKIVCGEKESVTFNIGNLIYDDLFTNSMNYYYLNRSGINIDSKYITSGDRDMLSSEAGHNPDIAYIQDIWKSSYAYDGSDIDQSKPIDLTGGWYSASDYGKYVNNGSMAVWILNNMYERAVITNNSDKLDDGGSISIPENENNIPNILDETRVEMEFLLKMQREDGMVYHKVHDYKWSPIGIRPNEDELTRVVSPVTTSATLELSAVAAQSYRLWKDYDSDFSDKCLETAKKAYMAAKANPYEVEPSNIHGTVIPAIDTENLYWAACELFASTGDETYYTDLKSYSNAFKITNNLSSNDNNNSFSSFDVKCTGSLGTLSLLLNADNLSDKESQTILNSIVDTAQSYVDTENSQGYGLPYKSTEYYINDYYYNGSVTGYEYRSNAFIANNAIIMAYAYDITGDMNFINGVSSAMDYLLGRNALEQSYITGYGECSAMYPYHKFWAYQIDKSFPSAPSGVLSSGPNSALSDPIIRGMGYEINESAPQLCYFDNVESWSTNGTELNWNAPLAWTVSYLEDVAPIAEEGKKIPYIPPTPSTETTTSDEEQIITDITEDTAISETIISNTVWGDANDDGIVDIRDITIANQYIVKMSTLTEQGMINYDVIHDGVLDIKDIGQLKKFIIKVIKTLDPLAV